MTDPILCPECEADALWPVLCAESPSVYCRKCRWQGQIARADATSVEMRRMREEAAKRKAKDDAEKLGKRSLVGSIFKYS